MQDPATSRIAVGTAVEIAPRGVADRLRAATMTAHVEAERAAMEHLFKPAVLSRPRYAAYLRALYEVYHALETQLERHRRHPTLSGLYFPELLRTELIAADCRSLGGKNGLDEALREAAISYRNRINTVAEHDPILLAAHIYTRYLGDLAGGQMLKNIIRRGLQLKDDDGVQSLIFPQIPDLAEFKSRFRGRLDTLALSAAAVEAVAAEALTSFALTRRLFESLALLPRDA